MYQLGFLKKPVLPSGVPDHFKLRLSRPAKQKAMSCCFWGPKLHSEHHLLHTSLPAAGTCAVPAVFSVTNTVIHVDFHIIQRNVSVGVGLFCTPGWSHRHTLSASLATSHFLYHTLFFISSHSLSHSLCSPPVFLLSSSSMVSALLAVLLTDSSWMSWLGQRQDPECVGWPLESICMGKAHTTLPHAFPTHPGGIPDSTKGTSLLNVFIC